MKCNHYILLLGLLMISCKQQSTLELKAEELINSDRDSIYFGDTLLAKFESDTEIIVFSFRNDTLFGNLIQQSHAEDLCRVAVSENVTDQITLSNYKTGIFNRNCTPCHYPFDPLLKNAVNTNPKNFQDIGSFASDKPKIRRINKENYLYILSDNKHWKYFMLDKVQKEMLLEYLIEKNQ